MCTSQLRSLNEPARQNVRIIWAECMSQMRRLCNSDELKAAVGLSATDTIVFLAVLHLPLHQTLEHTATLLRFAPTQLSPQDQSTLQCVCRGPRQPSAATSRRDIRLDCLRHLWSGLEKRSLPSSHFVSEQN